MIKQFIAITAALLLAGCGKIDQMTAQFTGYSTLCIVGVTYIQFTSGATPMIDKTGKPVECKP